MPKCGIFFDEEDPLLPDDDDVDNHDDIFYTG